MWIFLPTESGICTIDVASKLLCDMIAPCKKNLCSADLSVH